MPESPLPRPDFRPFNPADAEKGLAAIKRLNDAARLAARQKIAVERIEQEQLKGRRGSLAAERLEKRQVKVVERLEAVRMRIDKWAQGLRVSAGAAFVGTGVLTSITGGVASTPVLVAGGSALLTSLTAGMYLSAKESRFEARRDAAAKRRARYAKAKEASGSDFEVLDQQADQIKAAMTTSYEDVRMALKELEVFNLQPPKAPQLGRPMEGVLQFLESPEVKSAEIEARSFVAAVERRSERVLRPAQWDTGLG